MNENKSTNDKRIMGYVVEWKDRGGDQYSKYYSDYLTAAKAERWLLANGCDQCYTVVQLASDITAEGQPLAG